MALHPVRTTANTAAEHVADHNAYRAEFDAPTHTHTGSAAWQAHVAAALTASTTNPAMGTSPIVDARYVENGKTITGRAFFQFGSGMSAGSGEYRYVLPVAPRIATVEVPVGMGYVWIGGGSSVPFVEAVIPTGANYVRLRQHGLVIAVSNASPGTFVAGGQITFDFTYEAA